MYTLSGLGVMQFTCHFLQKAPTVTRLFSIMKYFFSNETFFLLRREYSIQIVNIKVNNCCELTLHTLTVLYSSDINLRADNFYSILLCIMHNYKRSIPSILYMCVNLIAFCLLKNYKNRKKK